MTRIGATVVITLILVGIAIEVVAEEQVRTRAFYLDEFIDAAVRRYPGMRAAEADIDAAQAQLAEAKFSPFFQFDGTAALFIRPGAEGTPVFSPDSQLPLSNRWGPGIDLQLEGGLPVYTFGKYRSGKKAARAGIAAAEQERERTLARVVFDVRRAYFGTQLSLDLEAMLDEGLGRLRNAVERLGERLDSDDPDAEQTDYWRLVSALAQIESRESENSRLQASARGALELLSGIKPAIVPECPLETVRSEVVTLSEHIRDAEMNRPEVQQLEAARSASDANLTIEKAGYFPDILLALTARFSSTPVVTNIDNPFIVDRGNNRNLAAGLVARWHLDFVGNAARVRKARAEIASLKARAEEARDGIELEVTGIYEGLLDAKRRNETWKRAERETRKWFVSAAQGYDVGTTDARELIDAIERYFDARSKRLIAVAEYNVAIAGLEKATGVPLVGSRGWRPVDCEE